MPRTPPSVGHGNAPLWKSICACSVGPSEPSAALPIDECCLSRISFDLRASAQRLSTSLAAGLPSPKKPARWSWQAGVARSCRVETLKLPDEVDGSDGTLRKESEHAIV